MAERRLLLGLDVGTSSIKASLVDADSSQCVASVQSPSTEMEVLSPFQGFAEQDPRVWWTHVQKAIGLLSKTESINLKQVAAIGITYQMHGLVLLDKNGEVVRPSIIWCDSRAVEIGELARKKLGQQTCQKRLLNSPGNFTASKIKWVMENEPEKFEHSWKAMLPGDYIAFLMTGEATTTASGLSEMMLWDYAASELAEQVLSCYGIPAAIIPQVVPTFGVQGKLKGEIATLLGLEEGVPVSYRAGDQPNNAFSLNVLEPGEVAATAGTSGVIYGVGAEAVADPASRVNTFLHVNSSAEAQRLGVLMCLNGTGILNSWLKRNVMSASESYADMNKLAQTIPMGSEGLCILPYGNGAERTLGNRDIGGLVHGLSFNTHSKAHLLRAAQEGIVFAMQYGLEIMRGMGVQPTAIRAGNANMFLSDLFADLFASVSRATVEIYDTDGAQGAARGAGVGAKIFGSPREACAKLKVVRHFTPDAKKVDESRAAYERWLTVLGNQLNN